MAEETKATEEKVEPAAEAVPEEKATPAAPAAKAAPAAATTATPKVPKVVIIIIVVILGLLVLGYVLAVGTSMFVGNQIMKSMGITRIIPSLDGSKTVTIGNGKDNITVSSSQKWPDTMPSVVPKFTAGKLTATSRFGDSWTVSADGVKSADLVAYKAKLVAAGWKIDGELNYGTTEGWTATLGDYTMGATLMSEEGNLVLNVTKGTATAPTE